MATAVNESIVRSALYTGALCTLVVTPLVSFEPINWIKLVLLSSGSLATIGLWLPQISEKKFTQFKIQFWLVFSFLVVATVSVLSAQNLYVGIWGNHGRATGLLAYFCLFSLACVVSVAHCDSKALLFSRFLLGTSLVVFIYMTIQFLGFEFIPWARSETFATLGNINFSSALVGLTIPILVSLVLFEFRTQKVRSICLLISIAWLIYIVVESGSLQGLLGAGFALSILLISIFQRIRSRRFVFLGFSSLSFVSLLFLIYVTTQRDLIGGRLFQETMAFRRDYWIAALNMMERSPILGLGFGQYGNFYREERDRIAAFRTGINRVSDSAHSIILDIGAAVGVLGLVLFLALLALTTLQSLLTLSETTRISETAVSLVWLAYLPQFFLGINSLGLSVWGWLAMGIIWSSRKRSRDFPTKVLGSKNIVRSVDDVFSGYSLSKKKNSLSADQSFVPASGVLLRFVGFSMGLAVSLPPFVTDARFNSAYLSGDPKRMFAVASGFGGSQHLEERTLDFVANNTSDGGLALNTAEMIIGKYPRSDFSWKVIYDLKVSPESLRSLAKSRIRALDPFIALPD